MQKVFAINSYPCRNQGQVCSHIFDVAGTRVKFALTFLMFWALGERGLQASCPLMYQLEFEAPIAIGSPRLSWHMVKTFLVSHNFQTKFAAVILT